MVNPSLLRGAPGRARARRWPCRRAEPPLCRARSARSPGDSWRRARLRPFWSTGVATTMPARMLSTGRASSDHSAPPSAVFVSALSRIRVVISVHVWSRSAITSSCTRQTRSTKRLLSSAMVFCFAEEPLRELGREALQRLALLRDEIEVLEDDLVLRDEPIARHEGLFLPRLGRRRSQRDAALPRVPQEPPEHVARGHPREGAADAAHGEEHEVGVGDLDAPGVVRGRLHRRAEDRLDGPAGWPAAWRGAHP